MKKKENGKNNSQFSITNSKFFESCGMFEAKVISNRKIGPGFHRLRLEFTDDGAKVFAKFEPGQFAQFDLSNTALPSQEAVPQKLRDAAGRKILLRRPFSPCGVTGNGDKIFAELLYCVVGPATVRMMTLSPHDRISVIGPLGRGFQIPGGKKTVLLVGGGMGTPPLQHLAQNLSASNSGIEIISLAGAKTAEGLPFKGRLDEISQNLGFCVPEFARYGVESLIATDDGSAGYHGLVTDYLVEWLEKSEIRRKPSLGRPFDDIIICACGPELMLARVAQIANEKNIDCQISMERRMACGIGLCQSCAVECRVADSNETIYKLCCQDGPVFNAREVVFS
jgi:dihydroorotate dehydrogenase electron transfer subunit